MGVPVSDDVARVEPGRDLKFHLVRGTDSLPVCAVLRRHLSTQAHGSFVP